MSRNITEIEKDYVDPGLSIYTRFELDRAFTYEAVADAVAALWKKHPILRSIIQNYIILDQSFFEKELYVEKVSSIPEDEKLFDATLRADKQLFKVTFTVRDHKTYFNVLTHHVVIDAVASIQVINELVKQLYFPTNQLKPLPMPESIEAYFDIPSPLATQDYAANLQKFLREHPIVAPPLNHPEVPIEQVVARMRSFEIEATPLIQSAKKQGVSVNSLMTALSIQALHLQGWVCIGTAVDLRRRSKTAIPEGLMNAPVGAFVFMEVQPDSSVESLAKLYQEKLLSLINSPDLLQQHYAITRGQLNFFDFKASFFLSNGGIAPLSPEVQDKITHLSFNTRALFNSPYLACLTHQGKMEITTTYPDPWIAPSTIDKLVQSYQ